MTTQHELSRPRFGLLAFPGLTLLDLLGPFEVFARVRGAEVQVVGLDRRPLQSDLGLRFQPQCALSEASREGQGFDLLLVPGGPGQMQLMENPRVLGFLRQQAKRTRYMTSVCTGSLILGAAGLLRGYRATTHWLCLDLLPHLGAEAVAERVVVDRDRICGAGVSAGLDLALVATALLCGEAEARRVQLLLEYDPAPPFRGGSPESAPPALVTALSRERQGLHAARREQVLRVVEGWAEDVPGRSPRTTKEVRV